MASTEDLSGPPYPPPNIAQIGYPLTRAVDTPVTSIFMVLYLIGAAGHMIVLQINHRRGHKFLLSIPVFGFCMSRTLTCALRLAVVDHQENISLDIAAQIFLGAGVLVLYFVIFLLAQRVLRESRPMLGWNSVLKSVTKLLYVGLFLSVALVIIWVNISFYTLDQNLRLIAAWVQKASELYIVLFNLASLGMFVPAVLSRTHGPHKFGEGSPEARQVIVGIVLGLALLESGYKLGTGWEAIRPASDPAWWQSKEVFYLFEFVPEIVMAYLLLGTRFDLRFWIPNGTKGPCLEESAESVFVGIDAIEKKNEASVVVSERSVET